MSALHGLVGTAPHHPFAAFAVDGASGPMVTPHAGVDIADRFWTIAGAHAAKVRVVARTGRAAVLRHRVVDDTNGWLLTAGRARVLDPRRPWRSWRDPVGTSLVGPALGLIGATYPDQLVGYANTWRRVPTQWALWTRVLLTVDADDSLDWSAAGEVGSCTGHFANPAELPRARRGAWRGRVPVLGTELNQIAAVPGPCAVGLRSAVGPLVVPGSWRPGDSSVVLPAAVVARLGAQLPGAGCVMIDRSDDPRPTHKVGLALRGAFEVRSTRDGQVVLGLSTTTVTSWHGFRSATADVPTPGASLAAPAASSGSSSGAAGEPRVRARR